MAEPDVDDLKRRMDGALAVLKSEFAGLRTGRAMPGLLEPIHVDAYGAKMPMNQIGTISAPDARLLTVQVWDRSLVSAVERAIQESALGLNPQAEGQLVRVPIPQLSEERRIELARVAGKYAEQAKIAIRNIRRSGIDEVKRMEKDGEMSQDEQHIWSEEIQELTDSMIKLVDEAFEAKEAEILQV